MHKLYEAMNRLLLFIFLFLGFYNLDAQSLKNKLDAVYGLSPVIYNGIVYSDYYNSGVKGDQFLISNHYRPGSVKLSGNDFSDLRLNYDIYRQKALLQFENQNELKRQIEIPIEHLKEFIIEDKRFIIEKDLDSSFKIIQVIGNGQITFHIYYFKTLRTVSSSVYERKFSDAQRKMWVQIKGKRYRIKTRRQLAKLFPEHKKSIKSWLKSKRIRFKKVSDAKLLETTKYLDSL